jgi:hypothetical protein
MNFTVLKLGRRARCMHFYAAKCVTTHAGIYVYSNLLNKEKGTEINAAAFTDIYACQPCGGGLEYFHRSPRES